MGRAVSWIDTYAVWAAPSPVGAGIGDLLKAIYSQFAETGTPHNDFYNDVGGRLFESETEEAQSPYAVYRIVSRTPDDTFTESLPDTLVQFSLFSSSPGPGEIADMYEHLHTLYHGCSLPITVSALIWMRESNLVHVIDNSGERFWAVDYEIKDEVSA